MSSATTTSYKEKLDADSRWAMSEGSLFFEGKGAVQDAFHRITTRLNELNIPYAVAGGMALYNHGFRRFTEDVDILVTSEGLNAIHDKLEGLGYLHIYKGSKALRETETGVKIDFLLAGQFPGDGKPKPVAFPDPALVAFKKDGISFVNLPTLINLKLASGISSAGRVKDLGDVQSVIEALHLPRDFSSQLNPYVQPKFIELWQGLKEKSGLEPRYAKENPDLIDRGFRDIELL